MAIGDAPKPTTPEESIEEVVWAEINKEKRPSHVAESEWSPEKRASLYLNNFYLRLPTRGGKDIWEYRAKKKIRNNLKIR